MTRILLFDLQAESREMTRDALASAGFEVESAPTEDAVVDADADAIVVGLRAPDVDGVTLLRRLRERRDLHPPVICLVSPEHEEAALEALREGAADYFVRPFEPNHLRNTIRRAIELHQAELLLNRDAAAIQAIAETELRYYELFHLANDAIFTMDSETEAILDANRRAETLTGYSRDELLKLTYPKLLPREIKATAHLPDEFGRGSASNVADQTLMTKDGRLLVVSVSASAMDVGGRKVINRICREVTRERALELELAKRARTLQDECSEKTKKLIESQTQLIQTEKMAALGSLVAGLAHEINTPLGAIHSNNDVFELAFRRIRELAACACTPEGIQMARDLDRTVSIVEDSVRTNRLACERLVKIVRNVRNFTRLDEAEWKRADIHDGIESTLTILNHEMKGRVTVIKEYGQVREIECFPNQLNQVFMNMLVNASQAIEGPGEIRIRTWEEEDTVRISISDNGKGIPDEVIPRIFDPGFTTKKAGLGTGLGLSICHKIIQNHNGRILVDSGPGGGASFTIVLPIDQREPKGNRTHE